MGNSFPGISINVSNSRNSCATTNHTHTETIYQIPLETQKILDDQKIQLKKFEEEARRQNDPKLYAENSQN